MKSIFLLIYILLGLNHICFSQNLKFKLYNQENNTISIDSLYSDILGADVILFGYDNEKTATKELGNFLLQKIFESNKNIDIGADYFITTDQSHIDNYLQGYIDIRTLRSQIVKTGIIEKWKLDFLDFAKTNRLSFTATKLPREYYSKVYQDGNFDIHKPLLIEGISAGPQSFEIDTTKAQYNQLFTAKDGEVLAQDKNQVLVESYIEATAAYYINRNHLNSPKKIMFHFNDKNRLENDRGIKWQLSHLNKEIRVLSIMFLDQNTISLEKMNNKETLKTDYYFLLPSETLETNGFIIEKFTHFYEFTGKSIEINSGDDF